ncbi:O-antigen polymerase [Clostridium neonatale]|uniref:O-antigen polymerase n=1 Tax=Clostridium neonatale TaxID=137838 RepID=UPI003D3382FB
MILELLIVIAILSIVSIIIFKRDFLAPSVLLTLSFFVSTLCAYLNSKKWNFSNPLLLFVVVIGLVSFIIFSFIIFFFDSKSKKKPIPIFVNEIKISEYKLCIYLIFQIVLYIFAIFYMMKNTGIGLSLQNLSNIIGNYYEANRGGMTKYSSQLVSLAQILNTSGIYILLFVAINNVVSTKKNHMLLYINIVVGILGSTLDGTRTAVFMYIIGAMVMYIAIINKKSGWKKNIKVLFVVKLLVLLIISIYLFVLLGSLQGRSLADVSVVDVISSYLGAPIKNLELFLNEYRVPTGTFGGETFMSTYNWLYSKTGNVTYNIQSLYQYRWMDGEGIGNVYTIFMPIYNDFGIYGVFIILGMMGIISQKIYDSIKFRKFSGVIDYVVIIYSYVAFAVMFSFFSNKFFELVISITLIYFIIGLLFFDFIFFKLHIRNSIICINKYKVFRRK